MDSGQIGQHINSFLSNLDEQRMILLLIVFTVFCVLLIRTFDYAGARLAAVAIGLFGVVVLVMILYNYLLST